MKIIGLITARGGSKGIPGKNVKILAGKPLIQYSIEAALQSKFIAKIAVSTDSIDIANISRRCGAEIPFLRPPELSQDSTPTLPVIRHLINYYKNIGVEFDAICLLQPTNPFRPKNFIDKCIQKFIDSEADSFISVLKVPHEFNPHWTFESDEHNLLKITTGEENIIPRRQELPNAYFRDGSVYIIKVQFIEIENKLIGGKISFLESNPDYYCNIDEIADWVKAEQMIHQKPQLII